MLADHALAALEAAPAGSDVQLQWSRTFASAARTDEHADVLRGLLDGSRTLEGLEVDADARWAFLSGLVAIGAAGDAEIDAEAERDATATGVRRAATARALRPTAESKAETWERAFHDDDGAQRGARGDAARLLAPGAARAHRRLRGAVLRRDPARCGTGAPARSRRTPSSTCSRRSSSRARSSPPTPGWPTPISPPPLRRLVSEGRDGIARALRARERDADCRAC